MTRRYPAKGKFPRRRHFFEQLVRKAIESLPAELKNRLENVAIIVEENPPSRPREKEERGQELLGLYHGVPHKNRGFWYGNVLPDRIVIYRKPLERISSTPEDLMENIRQTLIHEVGHYFGFEEEDLQQFEDGDF